LLIAVVAVQIASVPAADAHGAPTEPGSRTYLCRLDGTSAGGDIEPKNPACDAAVSLGGKQPLWDWFGVLRGDGRGRTRGFIPDGQLCSGGNPTFAGFDLPRNDWPYTRLTGGAQIDFRYNAWAAHPGEFRMYITKDGYDPTSPLGWDDLEPAPFTRYTQTSPNGTDRANNTPDYQWSATLPQKSGKHIIYSVWERSDSAETFYGCSDVNFDGGNGQVIGVGNPGPRPPTTTTRPTTTVRPTTSRPATTVRPTTTRPATTGPSVTVGNTTTTTGYEGNDGLGAGYWSTSGAALVDTNGNEVKIRGVNWFGFETAANMPHGLWDRSYQSLIDQVADLDFNTIRLPFSAALLNQGVRPNGINAAANPDMANATSLELMDAVIDYAGQKGLRVILDRHALGADNRHKLWYDGRYPEERFIADWELLARRYAGNTTVIGADLYNEPHDEACWGCDDPALDWRQAATEAGNAIHAINPGWLIFVEGVEEPDGDACDGPGGSDDCIWWGGNLMEAGSEPVVLRNPNKVVYSPHEYATSVHRQSWFDDPSFPSNLPTIWDKYWGYLETQNIAPVMVGEFGTKLEAQVDRVWLEDLLAYLDDIGAGFTFWTLNPNSGDTGGILNDDWRTVNTERYGYLKPYLLGPFDGSGPKNPPPPTTLPSSTVPTTGSTGSTVRSTTSTTVASTTTTGPTASSCKVEIDINAWNVAYVAQVTITNTGSEPIDGWQLNWSFNEGEVVQQSWGASIDAADGDATAVHRSWNAALAPGRTAHLGFIASHDGSFDRPPTGLTLNGVSCR